MIRHDKRDGSVLTADDDINGRVIGILAAQALRASADLAPDTTLESLGIDSLGLAEIVFAIEEAFDVAVPFDADGADSVDLRSVGAVCTAVDRLIRAQKG